MEPLLLAFLVTLGAGLATGIGSLLAFTRKNPSKKFLAFMLGLSAGVMIYVSLIEIFQKAVLSLTAASGAENIGYLWATLGFFSGFVVIAAIDRVFDTLMPHHHDLETGEDPAQFTIEDTLAHIDGEHDHTHDHSHDHKERKSLMRMGLFTALAIAIHNFPEGLATFIATLQEPALGFAFAVAIAIHNIPEGIAVSIPIYKATGSRMKAFWYSFGSGLAEPVGAFVGYFILMQFINDYVFGVVFAAVAGIMVYISLDELLPTAKRNDHHLPIIGVFVGMLIMAASLVLFKF
ncbi:MAG TPA: zinc transporter ZupT [Candidatus Paceibacterota bacterium]